MIEYTTHVEFDNAVTNSAVDIHFRVSGDRTCGYRTVVAGIATMADNLWPSMIWIGTGKAVCGMAVAALSRGIDVLRRFANSGLAVVADFAAIGDIRMIETTICRQFYKTRSAMTFIAFGIRLGMEFRFANRDNAIMAFTALPEHFLWSTNGTIEKPCGV